MPPSATLHAAETVDSIAKRLLACTDDELQPWLAQNQGVVTLALIQHLKDTYATADQIIENPPLAERATRSALQVAVNSANSAELLPLAQWARGLWAMYNDPAEAVTLFEAALLHYRAINDKLSSARLLANLASMWAECGANQAAELCFQEARSLLAELSPIAPQYSLALEQNFGLALHYWGRFEEALAVHDRALALAIAHDLPIVVAEIQVNRCLTLGRMGQFGEVEPELRQAKQLSEQHKQQLTVARIDLNLGELYTILGHPAAALRCFQQAAQGFAASNNGMELSVVLALRATLLRQIGALPVALDHYQQALLVLEQYNLKGFQGETLVNLAICLRLSGNKKQLQRAAALLNQAQQFWTALDHSYWITRVYLEQIRVAQAQNDLARAGQLLLSPPAFPANLNLQAEFKLLSADLLQQTITDEEARRSIVDNYAAILKFATEQGVLTLRRNAHYGLGKYYLDADWSRARQQLEAAAEVDEQIRQSLSLQELKASFHEQANDLFDDLIRAAYRQHEDSFVLLYGWRAKASAFLDLAAGVRAELHFTPEQQQTIGRLRQQIASLRWALAKSAEKNVFDAHYEEANPELAKLEQQLLELRRQSRQAQTHLATLTMEQLGPVLNAMEADLLLEYIRCGDELYGVCANKTGVCAVIRLVDVATIASIAAHLALSFHSFNALSQPDREKVTDARLIESQQLLQRCYAALIAPFQPQFAAAQTRSKILIAPCDVLALLPFAAFWTGHRYWIEEQLFELIPSGALLLLETPQAPAHTPALVIAASAGQATAVRQEAAKLAGVLNDCALFIDTPVVDYLSALQQPPRLLHIAAHTLQRGDAPLFTGVQLSGEVLSVEHSYELPLWGTELVTLSGCTTAGGMESEASLFAFQSAFLVAGAKHLLCTLWPIADGIGSELMPDFYTRWQTGLPVAAALRATQLHFLHHPSAYRHPALWAAFTCIRR